MGQQARSRPPRRVLVAAVVAVVLAVAGPFAYINHLQGDAPERLEAATATTGGATADAGASLDGTWTAGSGSQAGYRVKEVLFGQDTEAVGRTSAVTGELTLSGSEVSSGSFTVDLTQVTSDEDRRDSQFQDRIMETATYPTATFELAEPITLASLPADGGTVTASATGALTLHGTTRQVTVDVTVQRSGDTVQASGSIPSPSPTTTSPAPASAPSPPRTAARSSSSSPSPAVEPVLDGRGSQPAGHPHRQDPDVV